MKRDWAMIRQILMSYESGKHVIADKEVQGVIAAQFGVDEKTVQQHFDYMFIEGMFDGRKHIGNSMVGPTSVIYYHIALNAHGHDMLALIGNPQIWQRIKPRLARVNGYATAAQVKAMAYKEIENLMKGDGNNG